MARHSLVYTVKSKHAHFQSESEKPIRDECLAFHPVAAFPEKKAPFFLFFPLHNAPRRLFLVQKDERSVTKERMRFLLWSWGVMGEQTWGQGVRLLTLRSPRGA